MIACPECGFDSPEGSTHCVHCGAALSAAEGPAHTSHFGDQDVKNLVARVTREEQADVDPGNLLAGLPRPKAASMVSPLRGGQTTTTQRQPAPEKRRARSAAGSTVMGMPLYTTGEQGIIRPAPRKSAATTGGPMPAEVDSGASIQSLDAFQGDIEARRPSTPPAAADPAAADPTGPGAPAAPQEALASGADGPASRPAASAPPADVATPSAPRSDAPEAAVADASPASAGLASSAPSPDPARTSTGPLDLSQPASSSKAGLIAVVIVLAVVAAAVAFFALK